MLLTRAKLLSILLQYINVHICRNISNQSAAFSSSNSGPDIYEYVLCSPIYWVSCWKDEFFAVCCTIPLGKILNYIQFCLFLALLERDNLLYEIPALHTQYMYRNNCIASVEKFIQVETPAPSSCTLLYIWQRVQVQVPLHHLTTHVQPC